MILVGCAKTDDITKLQSQIDELKNDRITSIESQIAGINGSISALQNEDKELKEFIATLQQ